MEEHAVEHHLGQVTPTPLNDLLRTASTPGTLAFEKC